MYHYDVLAKKIPGVGKERAAMLVARKKLQSARRGLRWIGRLFRGRRGRRRREKQRRLYLQRKREYAQRKQEYELAKARQREYEYGYQDDAVYETYTPHPAPVVYEPPPAPAVPAVYPDIYEADTYYEYGG
jgi:hypothetical protein